MLITASVVFQQLNKLTSRYSATSVHFSPRLLLAGSLVISFLIYLFDNNIISYYLCSDKLLLKVFFLQKQSQEFDHHTRSILIWRNFDLV